VETGLNHDQIVTLWVFAIVVIVLRLLLGPRRQNFAHNLRHLILAIAMAAGAYWVSLSVPQLNSAAWVIAGIVGFFLFFRRPARTRQMKASVRRRVIAKWTAKTGKKFNPRIHEIDHIIPFSKGGGETEGNLRVVDKKMNRSKGAKGPWWDILGW
jgi:hypothetical protein